MQVVVDSSVPEYSMTIKDVTTGASRILLSETAPSWIELGGEITWLDEGRQFGYNLEAQEQETAISG